jgi:hypothetical protein
MKKKQTVSKDIPLSEITLRRYERPYNMSRRELVRKLCLSVGLLQPGDSRDVVVDILSVLLNSKKEMSSDEVKKKTVALRRKNKLGLKGIADSNIRRQLKRLRALFLVEKVKNNYRIHEQDELCNIFEERIEKFYLKNITDRVREYFKAIK